jgi:plastocyanin
MCAAIVSYLQSSRQYRWHEARQNLLMIFGGVWKPKATPSGKRDLYPRQRMTAGAVVLLVAVGLVGTVLVVRPAGQGREATTTGTTVGSVSTFSVSEPRTFYVEINCGAVAACTGGFMPRNLVIPAGSQVTWTSRENPELYIYHRVVFRVGGIDSGPMNGEDVFTASFPSTGSFQYYDADFPGNNGTITVVPPA